MRLVHGLCVSKSLFVCSVESLSLNSVGRQRRGEEMMSGLCGTQAHKVQQGQEASLQQLVRASAIALAGGAIAGVSACTATFAFPNQALHIMQVFLLLQLILVPAKRIQIHLAALCHCTQVAVSSTSRAFANGRKAFTQHYSPFVRAGLLGIGGGMIVGPLMLELGVHPLVSAATSSVMVLFSSSMGALAYAFDGALNLQFALVFGGGCCAASLVGVLLVARIVQRSGKVSACVPQRIWGCVCLLALCLHNV